MTINETIDVSRGTSAASTKDESDEQREEFALPHITVGIFEGRYKGALAYALRSALGRPATIDVAPARMEEASSEVPLDVVELLGPAGDRLVVATEKSDMLVVEVSDSVIERLSDPQLARLRRHTKCLLVEVNSTGQVVRVAGPIAGIFSIVPPGEGMHVHTGTDHATRVPPPAA
ncbi:hypothetical protein J2X11_000049 [Aeromicrobium panaciterrae]|uniref:CheW-like domain-containing protein n=1 Tax=Aeromicrobium panaciterrae TaxID=363861 RepID=A0ABU1UJ83_9ACTN|nr:hypothetical protein [Aeromicrobium panaciterrae]MDR7085210.1 hypothetical protein [Aeromicrobium panaciterrae]